jgi:site-specific recombinase XerD
MKSKNIKNATNFLLQWLKESNYSQNTIAFYRSRCNAVLAHAEQGEMEFNFESFMDWADRYTENRVISIQCCMRKVIVMLDYIIKGKPFPQGNYSFVKPLKLYNQEFAETVEMFFNHLQRRGLEKNTIKFSIYCANHFFSHMEKCSINSVAEITRKHLADYLMYREQNLENSTRRAMAYRLKQMLKYLYSQKLSSEDLSLCVITNFTIRKKVVTVLPEDAQKALTESNGSFSSVRLARDYAICMIALRLMLRKSDILKLKLSEIDWDNKKITIVQKKNKLPLTLPLTDDVGNALAVYILDFRPKSEYEEVFLRISFPIKPIINLNRCNEFIQEIRLGKSWIGS